MKKILITSLIGFSSLFATSLDTICTSKETLSDPVFKNYFKEIINKEIKNDVEINQELNSLKLNVTKLYDTYRKTLNEGDKEEKNTKTQIINNCDIVFGKSKFYDKNNEEYYGIYSYLMPNAHYYKHKMIVNAERMTKEEKTQVLYDLILYGKNSSSFIFPKTQKIFTDMLKSINGTIDKPTSEGEVILKSQPNFPNFAENVEHSKNIMVKNILNQVQKEKEGILQNLSLLGDNLYQNTQRLLESMGFNRKPTITKRKNLQKILAKQNNEWMQQVQKVRKEDPFVQYCKQEQNEVNQRRLKIGMNINVADQVQKAKDNIDAWFKESMDNIESTMLYYTSDEFIIATFVGFVVEQVATAKCELDKAAAEKQLATNIENITGVAYTLSASWIKKECEKQAGTDGKAVFKEEKDSSYCFFAINEQCKVQIPNWGDIGGGAGSVTVKNGEKTIQCTDNIAKKIAESQFQTCIDTKKRKLLKDVSKYLDKLNSMVLEMLKKKEECKEKSDVLFKPATLNDKERNNKELATGIINEPDCTSCDELKRNLESQGITTKGLIDEIKLKEQFEKMSQKEQEEMKRIETIEEVDEDIFNMKVNNYIGSLKTKYPNMKYTMWENLGYAKDMYKKVFIDSNKEARRYFSYWLKQLNSTVNKTSIIDKFSDRGIEIEDNNLFKDIVVDLHNANNIKQSNIFNQDIDSNIMKKINFEEEDYMKKVHSFRNEIFNVSAFTFVPNDLRDYGITSVYNLPIGTINGLIEEKMRVLVLDSDKFISSREIPDKEVSIYKDATSTPKVLMIEDLIEIKKDRVKNQLARTGERASQINDRLLNGLIEVYKNKILSMLLFNTYVDYANYAAYLSTEINKMNTKEKLFFEMHLYKLYKLIRD